MKTKRTPTVVTALKGKALIVRQIALDLRFPYVEEEVPDQDDLVRFIFDLSDADQQRFLAALPVEVFAYRAVIGKP